MQHRDSLSAKGPARGARISRSLIGGSVSAWLLVLIVTAAACFAADLDAPATKKVTIRSEIQRGADAVFHEALNANSTRLLEYIQTIERVLDKEKQNNTDTDGFYVGAYLTAWTDLAIAIEADESDRTNHTFNSEGTFPIAEDRAKGWFNLFREKEKALGLDDATVAKVLGMNFEVLKPRIVEWAAKKVPVP